MQVGRRQVDSTAIGVRRFVFQAVSPRSDQAAIDHAIVQARTHQRRIVIANAVGRELRQPNELIVMDRSLEPVTELHAVGVGAIDWRPDDDTDSARRVRNAAARRHDFFLSDHLRADTVDK